jgi:hypothetical protein
MWDLVEGYAADGFGKRVAEERGAVIAHRVALVFLVAVADADGVIRVTVADECDDLSETVFLGDERLIVGDDLEAGLGELVDGILDFHVDFCLKVSVAVVASMPMTLRKFLRMVNTECEIICALSTNHQSSAT